jgi:integrase
VAWDKPMTAIQSFEALAEGYLAERRGLGFSLTVSGPLLMNFARFVDNQDLKGSLTSEISLAWVRNKAKRTSRYTWARRLSVIRPFLQYLAGIDGATELPSAFTFGSPRRRRTPHIYTDKEITDLLQASRGLEQQNVPQVPTFETLFGLLASTGLRLAEALHLHCSDVNVPNRMLIVRETKFRKTRLVPLHVTTACQLAIYLAHRQRMPSTTESHFFVSLSGDALRARTVRDVFDRICTNLAWTARGDYPAPRIRDLRHTFICHRIKLWYERGVDIHNAILALSTYVGHVKVSHTYWYLTSVPELMSIVSARFQQFTDVVAQ